jgi:hypothetical protein
MTSNLTSDGLAEELVKSLSSFGHHQRNGLAATQEGLDIRGQVRGERLLDLAQRPIDKRD